MCNKCNTCGGSSQTNYNICNPAPCQEPQDCPCPTILSTDCVTYGGNDLPCSGITTGQTLTETVEQLDTFICEKVNDITNALTLKNIGAGSEVYKGVDLLGRKEIRKINAVGNLATVTQNTNDISVSINETNLEDFVLEYQLRYACDNIGLSPTISNEAQIYKETILDAGINEFTFRTIHNQDGTLVIEEGLGSIEISSKTFIEEGTNVTITGDGTFATPYVINSVDTNTATLLENSATTTVSGDGTVGNEYQVDVNNLQKVINTFPYTLLNTDDKYTLFVDNGASNVVVNVPDTLPTNFSVAFIQKGTGDVTMTPTGTSIINSALGYKIKGQYYWALLEKELATVTHYLIGSTKL